MRLRLKKFSSYFSVLAIPLIVIIFWSIIVFLVSVMGMFPDMEVAGELMVAASLAVIGSLIGGLMALMVGFNASEQGMKGARKFASLGALFGLITSLINGTLSLITSLLSVFTDVSVNSGLQGIISLPILRGLLIELGVLGKLGSLMDMLIDAIGVILVLFMGVITGAILAVIAGVITRKLRK